jgi:hypothetical protein
MVEMKKRSGKNAQMNMSFGTIFSIILIVVFIAFAIFGIMKFIKTTQFAQVEKFKSDLQADINTMWQSTQGSQKLEYSLPKKITKVCFTDDEFENLYFAPDDFNGKLMNNIDFAKTIPKNSDELCINAIKGKITLFVQKNYGENLVTITK